MRAEHYIGFSITRTRNRGGTYQPGGWFLKIRATQMQFEQLARIEREVGLVPANDNAIDALFEKPELPDTDDEPAGETKRRANMTPEEKLDDRIADRLKSAPRRQKEREVMRAARVEFERRQAVGNPEADNDNESWPLLTALKRAHDNDSIDFVLKYRKLVALVECEPLQGQRVGDGDLAAVRRSTNLVAKAEDALAAMKETDTVLPGGEIHYKEVKKRKGGTFHLPQQHAVATNDETKVRTAPIGMPFNSDLIVHKIDATPVLAVVRQALGPLLDPFEDAVLGGQTYTEIGQRHGANAKPDETGRVLVRLAILAAERALYDLETSIRKAEREADRRAVLRRLEIAVERARYLGRARYPRKARRR